jgi:hypothetical protein
VRSFPLAWIFARDNRRAAKKNCSEADPSVPPAEEEVSGGEWPKPKRESGVPRSSCRAGPGSAPDNGRRKPPPARLGNPPADYIPFHGKVCCQKACSMGGLEICRASGTPTAGFVYGDTGGGELFQVKGAVVILRDQSRRPRRR